MYNAQALPAILRILTGRVLVVFPGALWKRERASRVPAATVRAHLRQLRARAARLHRAAILRPCVPRQHLPQGTRCVYVANVRPLRCVLWRRRRLHACARNSQTFADLLSQSVYCAFCSAFPDSLKQFAVGAFRDFIIFVIHEWIAGLRLEYSSSSRSPLSYYSYSYSFALYVCITLVLSLITIGVRPSPGAWNHWNLHILMTPNPKLPETIALIGAVY